MFQRLDKLLDSFMELGIPGYDLLIYHKGKEVYRRLGGFCDLENKLPVRGDELYYIYSCSKVITVTAALLLYERGAFSLEDKLSKYIPEYKEMHVKCEDGSVKKAEREIRVKDLFCMTAGFNYVTLKNPVVIKFKEETEGRCPTREFAPRMAEAVLDFEPGTRWQYSLCHDVLASMVELWSGERFGDFVKKNIFDKADMTNTSFYLPPEEKGRLAPQYSYSFDTKKISLTANTNVYDLGAEFESGGGGGISTTLDMIKFGEALRTGKILKEQTLDLMTKNQIAEVFDSFWIENYAYGLGVRCPRGDNEYTDFGWGGAAGAGLWIDRDCEITAYYSQHLLNSPVIKKRNQIIRLIKEILGYLESSEQTNQDTPLTEKDKMRSSWGV